MGVTPWHQTTPKPLVGWHISFGLWRMPPGDQSGLLFCLLSPRQQSSVTVAGVTVEGKTALEGLLPGVEGSGLEVHTATLLTSRWPEEPMQPA